MHGAALLLGLAACGTWRQESTRLAGAASIDRDGARGAEIAAGYQLNGIGARVDVDGQRLERDEVAAVPLHRRTIGAGIGVGLTVSPLALTASDDRFTRWFDLGLAGSIGGGLDYPDRLTTYGQAWGGVWATLGLPVLGYSNHAGDVYPTLIVELRREAITDWDNRTVLVLGLALTQRVHSLGLFFGPH